MDLLSKVEYHLKNISYYAFKNFVKYILEIIGAVSSLAVVVSYFGLTSNIFLRWLTEFGKSILIYTQILEVPRVVWLLLIVFSFYVISVFRKVNLIAGTFTDNFSNGLINWEYGGEGWTVQRGENGYELSVTNSGGGGISNFGFWNSYSFSFECKIINRNVGWIIRATDRANYVMIQLSLPNENKKYISINPHYLVNEEWLPIERRLEASTRLVEQILSHQWLTVKIVVFGNAIDIFINKERVLNYHIPDPLRILQKQPDASAEVKKFPKETFKAFSFPAGRIGFRCDGQEHALIRNVKVEPKFWNQKSFY